MLKTCSVMTPAVALLYCTLAQPAFADDAADAADLAGTFVTAKEAGNRELLKHLTREEDYESVVGELDSKQAPVRENLDIDAVEVTAVDGDRATARVRYSEKHGSGTHEQDVEMRKVDGQWRVALPEPAPAPAPAHAFAPAPTPAKKAD